MDAQTVIARAMERAHAQQEVNKSLSPLSARSCLSLQAATLLLNLGRTIEIDQVRSIITATDQGFDLDSELSVVCEKIEKAKLAKGAAARKKERNLAARTPKYANLFAAKAYFEALTGVRNASYGQNILLEDWAECNDTGRLEDWQDEARQHEHVEEKSASEVPHMHAAEVGSYGCEELEVSDAALLTPALRRKSVRKKQKTALEVMKLIEDFPLNGSDIHQSYGGSVMGAYEVVGPAQCPAVSARHYATTMQRFNEWLSRKLAADTRASTRRASRDRTTRAAWREAKYSQELWSGPSSNGNISSEMIAKAPAAQDLLDSAIQDFKCAEQLLELAFERPDARDSEFSKPNDMPRVRKEQQTISTAAQAQSDGARVFSRKPVSTSDADKTTVPTLKRFHSVSVSFSGNSNATSMSISKALAARLSRISNASSQLASTRPADSIPSPLRGAPVQPDGPGHWEFLTRERNFHDWREHNADEGLAQVQLSGHPLVGHVGYVTAQEVFNVQQRTADYHHIDLLWVPKITAQACDCWRLEAPVGAIVPHTQTRTGAATRNAPTQLRLRSMVTTSSGTGSTVMRNAGDLTGPNGVRTHGVSEVTIRKVTLSKVVTLKISPEDLRRIASSTASEPQKSSSDPFNKPSTSATPILASEASPDILQANGPSRRRARHQPAGLDETVSGSVGPTSVGSVRNAVGDHLTQRSLFARAALAGLLPSSRGVQRSSRPSFARYDPSRPIGCRYRAPSPASSDSDMSDAGSQHTSQPVFRPSPTPQDVSEGNGAPRVQAPSKKITGLQSQPNVVAAQPTMSQQPRVSGDAAGARVQDDESTAGNAGTPNRPQIVLKNSLNTPRAPRTSPESYGRTSSGLR
ncbi:hypothetical protein LTR36_009185 [Oleoguttula mirabilis]|uniref:Uncharacterized protein n=1 Tax=Oleoguttula mirabilis TaxID=1507867 RepID=A0AAV9J650_9PEZI|nr:hypothetical protein LTR36_009185 [Oleoguttula mirabilis]